MYLHCLADFLVVLLVYVDLVRLSECKSCAIIVPYIPGHVGGAILRNDADEVTFFCPSMVQIYNYF